MVKHRYEWIPIALLILTLGYALFLYLQAKFTTDSSPRDEMYICGVHGAMRKSAVMFIDPEGLRFSDALTNAQIKDTLIPQCPICYEDRIKKAKETRRTLNG